MDLNKIAELRKRNIERNKARIQNQKDQIAKKNEKRKKLAIKYEQFANKAALFRNRFLNNQIARIEKRYKKRLARLNQQRVATEKVITKTQSEKRTLENSIQMTYYQLRIRILNRAFTKRRNKIKYAQQIAKITVEKANDKIQKINIDEGTALLRWDKKIVKLRDTTTVGRITNKINHLQAKRSEEIRALEKRKQAAPAFNSLSLLRDWRETFMAHYFCGMEVRRLWGTLASHVRRFSMFYIMGLIVLIFSGLTNGNNIRPDNIVNIIQSNTYILLIGLGMLLVIVGGYIDLSVGALLGFSGALAVTIYNSTDGNMGATVVLTIAFTTAIGLVQGFLVGYCKMPSFIVTLGGMLLFQGLILTITKSETLTPRGGYDSSFVRFSLGTFDHSVVGGHFHILSFFIVLSTGFIAAILLIIGRTKRVKYGLMYGSATAFWIKVGLLLGMFAVFGGLIANSINGIQYYIIYILVLACIFIFITQNMALGRRIYAMGGNKRAAILSGINVGRTTIIVFAIAGALVGFAAIVFTSQMTNATSSAGGGYELDVISSVFVGGASMAGGVGSVPGTIIGGLILGFINNGMSLLNKTADAQKIIKAAILLCAVGWDVYSHRRIG